MAKVGSDLFIANEIMTITFDKLITKDQTAAVAGNVLERVKNSDVSEVEFRFPDMVVTKAVWDLKADVVKRILDTYAVESKTSGADVKR